MSDGTPEHPFYEKVLQEDGRNWMVTCNEGWRESIVCTGMYEWSADWLVDTIQGQPYAPERKIQGV